MKKNVMPYIAKALSSDALLHTKRYAHKLKRKALNHTPIVDVFIKTDDPYSYLLIQALSDFEKRFSVTLQFHVFHELDNEMYPKLDMWNAYARYDAGQLAELYEFDFPETPPLRNEDQIKNYAYKLSLLENSTTFLKEANTLLHSFWFEGKTPSPSTEEIQAGQSVLEKNTKLLTNKGHYLGAMLYFEGEWYWGVDRLDHLEQRLIDSGLYLCASECIRFNRTYRDFCQSHKLDARKIPSDEKLTLYWSARSPYSYIGLEKSVCLSKHYKIQLEIKPVLPMMMRGMNVPNTKKMYIFLDTKREARKYGIPYGFVADPLGEAVERCYALVEYAQSEGRLEEFLLSFARAVNSEGVRGDTDEGMKLIVTRSGLDWQQAKQLLGNQSWQEWAKENLDEMFDLGCWGVPTIRYGNTHYWGQDRFGMLEKKIRIKRS